jgi:hypothetical protein
VADATVTLSYDYEGRVVWLVALTEESHPMVHDLCADHGDRLSVPRGWMLRDERPQVTEQYAPADPTGAPAGVASAGDTAGRSVAEGGASVISAVQSAAGVVIEPVLGADADPVAPPVVPPTAAAAVQRVGGAGMGLAVPAGVEVAQDSLFHRVASA